MSSIRVVRDGNNWDVWEDDINALVTHKEPGTFGVFMRGGIIVVHNGEIADATDNLPPKIAERAIRFAAAVQDTL